MARVVEKFRQRVLTVPAAPCFSRPMPSANTTAVTKQPTLPVERLVASVVVLALVVVVLITSLQGAG